MAKRIIFTNSELGTWRTCRRKWELAYEQQLTPRATKRYLSVGSAIHEGAERMYRILHSLDKPDDRERRAALQRITSVFSPTFDDSLESVRRICVRAAVDSLVDAPLEDAERDVAYEEAQAAVRMFVNAWYEHDRARYQVVDVERMFVCKVLNDEGTNRNKIRTRGKFDLVLRDRETGELILGEHKSTAGAAYDLEMRIDVDPQVAGYVYAASQLYGEPVNRVIYNVVRKKPPQDPKVNKDGTVSMAKCDTTREYYQIALEAQRMRGIEPNEKQQEFLFTLPETTSRWAHRLDYRIDPEQVEQWRRDVIADGQLMRLYRRGMLPASRNGASCRGIVQPDCPYRPLCLKAHPEIVASEYDTRVHRHPELDGEDVVVRKALPVVSSHYDVGF